MAQEIGVKVTSDTQGLSAGLAKAQGSVNNFKKEAENQFKQVGASMLKAFAVGALIQGVKGIADEFDRVAKLATRFGESAESIQRVSEVSSMAGADIETVAKAMQKAGGNAVEAIKGNDKLSEAFGVLGINAATFVDLPMEEKLIALSDGYIAAGEGAEAMAAAEDVLGKGAMELIPLFTTGGETLRGMFADAAVASDESVKAIEATNDKIAKVFLTIKATGAEAIGFLITRVEALGTALAAIVAYISELPNGFTAAAEAADRTIQAAADLKAEEEAAAATKAETQRKMLTTAESISQRQDATKDKGDDKESKKAEAAKEKEAAQIEKMNEDLAKQTERNLEADAKKAEKAAKDKAKAEVDAKKDALKAEEGKLSDLDKASGAISVDSLRAIGGGLGNVNYNAGAGKEELQKKSVALQEQTVEELRKAVAALEARQSALSGDGSFSLS